MNLRYIIDLFPRLEKRTECNTCDIRKINKDLSNLEYVNSIININYNSSNSLLSVEYLDQDGIIQVISTSILDSNDINISQQEDNYSNLIDGTEIGQLAHVRNSQGTSWLPGSLGGTYYPAGIYIWDGLNWVSDRNALANQLANNIFNITGNTNDINLLKNRVTIIENEENVTSDTFEVIAKNLKAYPSTLNYTGDKLTSIVYDLGSNQSITKTLNYTEDNLTSIVLSGDTPSEIDLTKTLSYTGNSLTSITYS